MRADEGPLARMLPHVDNQHALVNEGGVAVLADIWPFTCRPKHKIFILTQAKVRNGEGDIGDEEKQNTCSLPTVYEGQTFSNIVASLYVGQTFTCMFALVMNNL